MSIHRSLFSSATDEWATPQDLFDTLHAEFGFTLDVCASPDKAKCPRFFSKEVDGLIQPWSGTCWMNPPYGRGIGVWIRKARTAAKAGATVVCLLPARTDTQWFHDDVLPFATDIRFVKGRLKFGGAEENAPFPSVIVVFGAKSVPSAAPVAEPNCQLSLLAA